MYGLIGKSLKHSISPQIHTAFFEEMNIKGCYDLLEVSPENLKGLLLEKAGSGYRGLNVTIPYKTEIMKYLRKVSPEAERIGAVNTIYLKTMEGFNTDYYGIEATFKKMDIEVKGEKAAILGTGGASKAAKTYLIDADVDSLVLVSRNPDDVKSASDVDIISYSDLYKYEYIDILVNCTPVGMYPDIEKIPIDPKFLENVGFVFDMIYNPYETLLIKRAKELRIPAINGLMMLVYQALRAQEIWNNIDIENEVKIRIYEKIKSYMLGEKDE